MTIKIKRAYDKATKADGFRILVDRLWPRGVSKDLAKINLWAKDVAPSSELRTWFHEDKESRFDTFSKRYMTEIANSTEIKDLKKTLRGKKVVTIVTGVKDIEQSHIPTLLKLL